MIRFKAGVRMEGLSPQISLALSVVNSVMQPIGLDCFVTSLNDGKHSRRSLHYKGLAADLRVHHIPPDARASIMEDIAKALGENYEIFHESVGTPNEHYHLEYDPVPRELVE